MDMQHAMERAARLAVRQHPHPNPRVGAVVLDGDGRVVGAGAHAGPGTPHAEVLALAEAGDLAAGATLVVTLEPCDHHGRTPPCTEVIIASGISAVVVGALDPDLRVSGRGATRLRKEGVDVEVAAADIAERVDPGYFVHRRTGRPRVTLKLALTLDGQAAAADGSSRWITSPEARADAHRLRAASDAVLVGAGTVIADDPRLAMRLEGHTGPQPRPVVVLGATPVPDSAKVFARDPIVYAPAPLALPVETRVLVGPDGVDLEAVLDDLGKLGVVDLMVEGGPRIAGSLLREGLVDRLVLYLGAALAGGTGTPGVEGLFARMGEELRLEIESIARVGPDIRIDAAFEGGG